MLRPFCFVLRTTTDMLTVLAAWLLGVLQGMRHALEPDHVAAVSTLVAEQRSVRASALYAAAWGLGHAFVLLLVGGVLLALRTALPDRLMNAFELVVGLMLVVLGLQALGRAAGRRGRQHLSRHHALGADHVHVGKWTMAKRPLLVGAVHGLAGSGALAALVMAKLPSWLDGVLFMALFGAGATLGMAMLAGIAGAPLARLARTPRGTPVMLALSGALSLVLGVAWGVSAAVRAVGGASQ